MVDPSSFRVGCVVEHEKFGRGTIAALEGEQRSLDEATSLYERGQSLVKRCGELLDQAELKIRQLSGSDLADFEEA